MNKYGLIGKKLDHSFSKSYFSAKFKEEEIEACYDNFEFENPNLLQQFLANNTKKINGLNVTIPYKETVIPSLYRLQKEAKHIGAVNTIKITNKGNLIGYNTDAYGFLKALMELGDFTHQKALILGTGGASKAVAFSLRVLGITYLSVSRNPGGNQVAYQDVDKKMLGLHTLIINTTPLGTAPNISEKPAIPYQFLTKQHTLFDLVYNPAVTSFLKEGQKASATITNGYKMLVYQAEKSWEIWNS